MDGFRKAVKAAMGSASSGTDGYTKIMGNAVATAEQMKAYLKAKNPSVAQSVLDMVPLYLSEGKAEGVRGDVAFAQSCLETGNFTFSGSAVILDQNNFCGMGVTSNGMKGNSFDTPQLGIRAQVQHLKGYSTIKTVRGVLRPAFQMAVDDDVLHKNPFGFELATVVVNDSVTREAVTREQMRKFLKFVHDDNVYCKYYEVVYILFHTGLRISEFCGLTLRDVDLENKILNIDHQLQRTANMKLVIESTKTNAGTRKLPMTEDVAECFRGIIEDREPPRFEKVIDGYSGFLFVDKDCNPLVAMHWEHRFNHMVKRYNEIYRVQMPNITPHVCRHTYCSNMAKSGMNPKTLQYLMGHSDIGVTLNTYTHLGLEDAADELKRMEELETARKELEKNKEENKEEKPVSQKMFRAI